MRWLIDEMLPRAAELLNQRGHDVVSVHDVGLTGAADSDVFDLAVADQRLVVTENFADYSLLLTQHLSNDQPCVPVVFIHKPRSPRGGALAGHLTARLDAWAAANPDPYVGAHWP
ncbi:MAG: DUF5615 family PIN-like protein [Acidimicrobiales bacterium]